MVKQSGSSSESTPAPAPGGLVGALEQVRTYLKGKDDTSRFVGLALLKTMLDNQPQVREDQDQIILLWESIPTKFLDRLLLASRNGKVSKEEAKDMVDIAVAVLHVFAILLPVEKREATRLTGRLRALVETLVTSSAETTTLVLETILTIVTTPLGTAELLNLEDTSPLTELATQHKLVLDIFSLAWLGASTQDAEVSRVRDSINKVIPKLLASFSHTDAVTLLACLGETLPKLPAEVLPPNPGWLAGLLKIWRQLVVSRPTAEGRAAYTRAAAALLQTYPNEVPSLFFKDDAGLDKESKPFSYLFINLLLIDIRSSLTSLLSKLNSTDYPAISARLAAASDILSNFIAFLIRSFDEADDQLGRGAFTMAPDLLLKLRKDIAETMGLSVEFMRDRWDASIAGAAGLHPEAITQPARTEKGERLTIAWDSMKDDISSDKLTLASIRTLAIWLREDDNDQLRVESAGLMDLLVELYRRSASSGLDFRDPILTVLEAVLTTDEGVETLLAQDGLRVLSQDLVEIVQTTQPCEAARGIEIVRVLLAVLDHPETNEPREDWMQLVKVAAAMKHTSMNGSETLLEFRIAILQLAAALLALCHGGMLKRYSAHIPGLVGCTKILRAQAEELGGIAEHELGESLDDVILSLEGLR